MNSFSVIDSYQKYGSVGTAWLQAEQNFGHSGRWTWKLVFILDPVSAASEAVV